MSDTYRRDAAASKAWQKSHFGYLPRTWWIDPSWVAVRLARATWRYDANGAGRKARFCAQLNSILTGADFEKESRAGDGLLLTFPLGSTFFANVGEDYTGQPLAGLGSTMFSAIRTRPPRLGSGVTMGGLSGCMGDVQVGDGAYILPGVGTVKAVPAGKFADRRYPDRSEPIDDVRKTTTKRGGEGERDMDSSKAVNTAWRLWKSDVERTREEARRFNDGSDMGGFVTFALLNSNLALLFYRFSHAFNLKGWNALAAVLTSINRYVFKLTLPPQSRLGAGVWLPHLAGTVIRGETGSHFTAFGGGSMLNSCGPFGDDLEHPWVGNSVMIGAHGGVFDRARIGDDAQISPKTNVHDALPSRVSVFAKGISTYPIEPFKPMERAHHLFSLPAASIVRQRDRAARGEYEAKHGRLPFQSRLAVRLFRKSQRAWMEDRLRVSRVWWLLSAYITGANISARSAIAPGLVIVCPAGVNFDGAAGDTLLLTNRCFVGGMMSPNRTMCDAVKTPHLGDKVVIKPDVAIYTGCKIGDRVVFEPGAIVREDIPAGTRVRPPGIRVQRQSTGIQ